MDFFTVLASCYSLTYLPEFSVKNSRIYAIVTNCISLLDFPSKDDKNNNYYDDY